MHKTALTIIGGSVAVVILVIAYRVFEGAGATAKVGEIEVSVDAREDARGAVETQPVNVETPVAKKKVEKQFSRRFDFKDITCDVNSPISAQYCVDSPYLLDGLAGEVEFTSKDRCGSRFVNFEKTSDRCGNVNVVLQGCGYDAEKICVSHAFLRGNITLQGYALQ